MLATKINHKLDNLPIDIFIEIFKYLTVSEFVKLSQLSKYFNNIIYNCDRFITSKIISGNTTYNIKSLKELCEIMNMLKYNKFEIIHIIINKNNNNDNNNGTSAIIKYLNKTIRQEMYINNIIFRNNILINYDERGIILEKYIFNDEDYPNYEKYNNGELIEKGVLYKSYIDIDDIINYYKEIDKIYDEETDKQYYLISYYGEKNQIKKKKYYLLNNIKKNNKFSKKQHLNIYIDDLNNVFNKPDIIINYNMRPWESPKSSKYYVSGELKFVIYYYDTYNELKNKFEKYKNNNVSIIHKSRNYNNSTVYYKDGYKHRVDKPAYIGYYGCNKIIMFEEHYFEGKYAGYGMSKPAYIKYNENNEKIYEEYRNDDSKLLEIHYSNGNIIQEKYYYNNMFYNDDKPSVFIYYENGNIKEEIYLYCGDLFRFDKNIYKPAHIKYYENGNIMEEIYYIPPFNKSSETLESVKYYENGNIEEEHYIHYISAIKHRCKNVVKYSIEDNKRKYTNIFRFSIDLIKSIKKNIYNYYCGPSNMV
jgi:hypothetical protein